MIGKLLAPVARLKAWWSAADHSQKQTRLAIAALLVGVIALTPVWNDLMAPPEEKLVKLGYRKTYEDFWRAVSNKHPEAVALFAKAGLRLERREFIRLFDDRVFNKEVFETLKKGDAVSSAHCPTDIRALDLYRTASVNPDKLAAIRGPCATASVVKAIQASRAAEARRLSDSRALNQDRPRRLAQCTAKYQAEGDQRLLAEASRFNLLSVSTYTERQCVLANLNKELLVGALNSANARESVTRSIHRCCQQYDADIRIDDAGLRAADDALAILKET